MKTATRWCGSSVTVLDLLMNIDRIGLVGAAGFVACGIPDRPEPVPLRAPQSTDDRIGEMRAQEKARKKQITDEIAAIKKNMVASKRWTQQQSDRLPMPKLKSPAQLSSFYESLAGAGGTAFVAHPFGETRPCYVHQQWAVDADRGFLIYLTPAKPGKYHLRQMLVSGQKEQQGVWPKHEPMFEVTEGQVTYAGSVQLLMRMEKRYGVFAPGDMRVQVVDDYAFDAAAIRAQEPRPDAIAIRNGVARQGGSH